MPCYRDQPTPVARQCTVRRRVRHAETYFRHNRISNAIAPAMFIYHLPIPINSTVDKRAPDNEFQIPSGATGAFVGFTAVWFFVVVYAHASSRESAARNLNVESDFQKQIRLSLYF